MITEHFDQAELERSEIATRAGINNAVPADLMPNLLRLCQLLEKVRALVGPVSITSGYRCPEVNARAGGARNSAHLQARAADIHVGHIAPRKSAEYIAGSAIQFDKCIVEFDAWVHIQVEAPGAIPRREVLTATHGRGSTIYTRGIPA